MLSLLLYRKMDDELKAANVERNAHLARLPSYDEVEAEALTLQITPPSPMSSRSPSFDGHRARHDSPPPQPRVLGVFSLPETSGAGPSHTPMPPVPSLPSIEDALVLLAQRPSSPTKPRSNSAASPPSRCPFQRTSTPTFPPVTIPSTSDSLAGGFSRAFPSEIILSHSITFEDWQTFIDHTNGSINRCAQLNPEKYAEDTQALVAQWSVAFFEPRGLRVFIRPDDSPQPTPLPSPSVQRVALPPSPPRSPSPQLAAQVASLDDTPVGGWTSPHAAKANAAFMKVEKKLEEARRKADLAVQATQKKVLKEAQRIEKLEKKEQKAREKKEKKARGRSKSVSSRAYGYGHWELVVECI